VRYNDAVFNKTCKLIENSQKGLDMIHGIYAESGHDFSGDICPGATLGDLDAGAIKTFRRTWREYSGNKRIANLSAEQLLSDCGALSGDGVTYAALILFGKRDALTKYLPHAEIVFEYRSSEAAGPAAQRVEFHDGFFNSYDRIWELVNLRNDQQHYQNGFHVFPVYTFNEQVVRESVLNAVSHRDYQLAGSIFVRQYQSRIVIENPGGFPAGITIENILDKQAARNYRIAEIFRLCGLVERAGQGMNLIFETSVKEAKPLPDFSGSDAWFVKLTLNGKVHHPRMLAMIKKLDDDKLDAMTTDDYLLLAALFRAKGLDDLQPSRFEHLAELEIVKYTEQGIELANGDLLSL
jgi:ATP-dependent DNA helicase RecG